MYDLTYDGVHKNVLESESELGFPSFNEYNLSFFITLAIYESIKQLPRLSCFVSRFYSPLYGVRWGSLRGYSNECDHVVVQLSINLCYNEGLNYSMISYDQQSWLYGSFQRYFKGSSRLWRHPEFCFTSARSSYLIPTGYIDLWNERLMLHMERRSTLFAFLTK